MTDFRESLNGIGLEYSENEPLALHSTFRIGGVADWAVFPRTERELIEAVSAAKRCGVRYTVIGRGSNVLFADGGYRGMVIFTSRLSEISVDGTCIRAGCGASLRQIALCAADKSLGGMTFAHGIPGSFGGAVYMNAGAFGSCIADVLASSTCFDPEDGTIRVLDKQEHAFGNRHSIYSDSNQIILGGTLCLFEDDREKLISEMDGFMRQRREKQPLEYPSAGSVFKRPEGHFAGKLIEDAGLKGLRVGGAEVSRKHAGFIVNTGGATAADVLELIESIRTVVRDRFGVTLEPEIRYIE